MKSKITATKDLNLSLAKRIAESAAKYLSDIRILCRNKSANAKSLIGVIALSYQKGAELLVMAEGKDAVAATEELRKIL